MFRVGGNGVVGDLKMMRARVDAAVKNPPVSAGADRASDTITPSLNIWPVNVLRFTITWTPSGRP